MLLQEQKKSKKESWTAPTPDRSPECRSQSKTTFVSKAKKQTCASKILENFVPQYNAEVIDRLEKAGMIVIGKTNMDEFAMGSTTETSAYGVTRNPWDLEHVPGGSSGGSCAAVAAGEAFMALGSDTGGSIRQPSSFCGVTGINQLTGTIRMDW